MGAKKETFLPFSGDGFRITDGMGRFLEILGYYDPMKEPAEVKVHGEKVTYWLEKGAKVSGSARAILKKEGLLSPLARGQLVPEIYPASPVEGSGVGFRTSGS